MQSQLIFLIALVAGCTAVTFDAIEAPEQDIPTVWNMWIENTLGVNKSEILEGIVVIYQGKNFVQLKDGRFLAVKLKPARMNGTEEDGVNMDFNVRLNFPLDVGMDSLRRGPTSRSMKFFPSQSFVYMSRPGDVQTLPCWEIDYNAGVTTYGTDDGSYGIIFDVRKASECY